MTYLIEWWIGLSMTDATQVLIVPLFLIAAYHLLRGERHD